jgi:Disulphide bond corrector protein DsbC
MGRPYLRTLTSVFVALVAVTSGLASAAADDSAKPAKKDSPAGLKPKTVVLSPSIEPALARPGDTVTFKVTAKLDPGFHIYKYAAKKLPGPETTNFDFFDREGLELVGGWTASREPEKHKDPAFAELEFVEYYENDVTWSVKLKVPIDLSPGKKTLRCQAGYQVCDSKGCSVPGKWTLPQVELTVLPATAGGAPAAAVAIANPKQTGPDASNPSTSEKTTAVAARTDAEARPAETTKAAATSGVIVGSSASSVSRPPDGSSPLQSEIAQKAQAGLIPFLIASAIGGLFALVMPCVWPMVPITVNFFIKQG